MRFKYECEVMSLRTQNWELHFIGKTVTDHFCKKDREFGLGHI